MSELFLTLEQVAEQLGLHVRTVRAYVRDGRLKATRIGKQYRVTPADLAVLTGGTLPPPPPPVATQRRVEISSVVRIDAIAPAQASRISNTLVAVCNGGGEGGAQLNCVYNETYGSLKVMISASLASTIGLLQTLALLQEQGGE